MLFITTSDPQDLRATNVACISQLQDDKLRAVLAHDHAKIRWSPVEGGAMGTIAPSRYHHPSDGRVYLKPSPNSVVLATRPALQTATQARSGAIDAPIPAEKLPSWVQQIEALAAATGTSDSPWALAQVTQLPASIQIPRSVRVPAPDKVSLFLETAEKGFVLRGKAMFSSESRAALFASGVIAGRSDAMSNLISKALLRQMQAFNAVKGLRLKHKGSIVTFATTLSIADTRAIFRVAADWATRYFGRTVTPPPNEP